MVQNGRKFCWQIGLRGVGLSKANLSGAEGSLIFGGKRGVGPGGSFFLPYYTKNR
ncbi:hypothetical protein REIS_2020 [Rickettsia endosymbiont of Ixodes scapularis]|nr:hypothetical protein REIS_2020 [Rickettsia endosymbiont of Ixodes scapularis]